MAGRARRPPITARKHCSSTKCLVGHGSPDRARIRRLDHFHDHQHGLDSKSWVTHPLETIVLQAMIVQRGL
jgi:hypothetical protein